jgi:RNA polymerase sigma-70 factor, ECF subfamily
VAQLVGGFDAGVFSSAGKPESARTMGQVSLHELVTTVHRQMRSVAGPCAELEDLTQVALEQIVRSMSRFRGDGELTTFTYRICVHVALNHWRSFRRWFQRFTHDEAEERPSLEADPSDLTIELERARRLYACLDQMDAARRVVVTLADLEDLPASRIAEIVGCPEPTVRSRLRRGRLELAELLAREPIFQDPPQGGIAGEHS